VKRLFGGATVLLLAGAACGAPSPPVAGSGERIYQAQCYACHALEPGRNSAAGPTLNRIVDRAIAVEPGFNYSPALRRLAASQGRWTPEKLDRFLADPEAMVPGNEMGFEGLRDRGERRALIEWLRRRDVSD
jgi:cytochrome c